MADFDASKAEKPAVASAHDSGNQQRILVVEDDLDIRRLNVDALRKAGYQVESAEDGAFAWSALKSAPYNLVVTDNDMPKVTGLELIEKIRIADMNLPVIMASGSVRVNEFMGSQLSGPTATLRKPYDCAELVCIVNELLTGASAPVESQEPGGLENPRISWQR